MAERNAIYNLAFEVVKSEQQQAIKSIKDLSKELFALQKAGDSTSQSTATIADKLQKLANAEQVLRQLADEAKYMGMETDDSNAALQRAYDLLEKIGGTKAEVGALADELHDVGEAIEDATTDADRLASRLDRADENFDVISRRVGLAGDVESNLSTVGSLASRVGGQGIGEGVGVAGEIAVLAEELPRLKFALQNLPDVAKIAAKEIGAGGIGLIGALAALGVAFALARNKIQKERELIRAGLTARTDVSEFIASGATTAEAQARIDELKRTYDQQVADLATFTKEYEEGRQAAEDALGKGWVALADVTGVSSAFEEYQDKIQELKTSSKGTEKQIEGLTDALESGSFAANDMATAEADLAQQRQVVLDYNQRLASQIEEQIRAERDKQDELNSLISEGTEEELQAKIDAARREREINKQIFEELGGQEMLDIAQKVGDTALAGLLNSYKDKVDEANTDLERFLLVAGPAIEAREQEVDALEALTQATNDRVSALLEQSQYELEFNRFLKTASIEGTQSRIEALREERESILSILPELHRLSSQSDEAAAEYANATDRLRDIAAELGDLGTEGISAAIANEQSKLDADIEKILSASAERIASIRADLAQKEADLYEDLQTKLADAVTDATEKREEMERDYAEKSVEIAEDLADKRLEIERKFARSQEQAVGDRDALALYQAQQARDEEMADAEASAKDQQEALQKNYAKQLETINRELAKQQATIQAQYNAQLNIARINAQNAINLENQKAQQEINVRQQAFNAQVAQLQSFATTGTGLIASFATNSLTMLQNMASGAMSLFGGASSSSGSSGSSSGGGVVVVPDGGMGGGTGGYQTPFADPFQSPTATPIAINVTGDNAEKIVKEVGRQLYGALSAIGL